jgi:hypothetical protein
MKYRVPASASVRVRVSSASYDVKPVVTHFGAGPRSQLLAHISAVGVKEKDGIPESCHLSRSYATLEEAEAAFKEGFEVGQPETAPATRANQILCALRRATGVVARP